MHTHHIIKPFFSKYLKDIRFVFFVHEYNQQPLSVAHEEEMDVLLPFPSLQGLQFCAAVAFYCKKAKLPQFFLSF